VKRLVAGVTLILAAQTSPGLTAPTTDFRKANWGMTQAQVVATESTKPSLVDGRGGEVVVRYDSFIFAGMACRLVYIFAGDKLVRAKYVFQREHSDKNDFLGDFTTVDPFLVEKFGKPSAEHVFWKNDLYKDEPRNYGLAASMGHLQYLTRWKDLRTVISHVLTGDNHVITHEIEYVSVELEQLEDQVLQEQAKKK